MPKVSNKLSNLNILKSKNPTAQEQVKNLASYAGTKDFEKREWNKVLPPMTCNPILVEKFRKEAKSKKWKFTTLMNEILEERYGKIDNESENN